MESVCNQTYRNLEVILVNDGSPDGSGLICDLLAAADTRIKVFHQANLGGCVAMQRGVDIATGDYMMFVDGDDWIELNTCEVALDFATKNNVDFVFWSRIKEFEGQSIKAESIYRGHKLFKNDALLDLRRRFVGLIGNELRKPTVTDALSSCWGKLFRISIFKNSPNAIVDEKGHQNFDALIMTIVLHKVNSAMYIDYYFSHYRRFNQHSMSRNHGYQLLDKYLAMFERFQGFLDSVGLSQVPAFQNALMNRIALSVINITQSFGVKSPISHFGAGTAYLSRVLSNETYHSALQQLPLKFMPIHWRFFFVCCRMRLSWIVYVLGVVMRRLR